MLEQKEKETREALENIFAVDSERKKWIDELKAICLSYGESLTDVSERYIYNIFWSQGYWSLLTRNVYWTKTDNFFVKPRHYG